MVELVPHRIIVTLFSAPEGHNIIDCLGVLSLFVLANAIFLQNSLPFFRKTLRRTSAGVQFTGGRFTGEVDVQSGTSMHGIYVL